MKTIGLVGGIGPETTVPYIHDTYMGELFHGKIRPETRRGLLAIVDRIRRATPSIR